MLIYLSRLLLLVPSELIACVCVWIQCMSLYQILCLPYFTQMYHVNSFEYLDTKINHSRQFCYFENSFWELDKNIQSLAELHLLMLGLFKCSYPLNYNE